MKHKIYNVERNNKYIGYIRSDVMVVIITTKWRYCHCMVYEMYDMMAIICTYKYYGIYDV